jgi:hypothetical protein
MAAAARAKLRIKSPFYAIPQPGRRPFVCDRNRYENVIKNLDSFTQDIREDGHLEVVGNAGNVRGRYVFYDLWRVSEWRMVNTMRDWARRMDKIKAQPAKPALNKYQKQIAKLERELGKLDLKAPRNPLLHEDRDASGQAYYNRELADWAHGKQLRKQLARVAGQVLKSKITTVQGYKLVREIVPLNRTHSQLRKHEERTVNEYWRDIWRFVDGAGAHGYRTPTHPWYRQPEDWTKLMDRHAEYISEWIANIRQGKALRSQIEALRLLETGAYDVSN